MPQYWLLLCTITTGLDHACIAHESVENGDKIFLFLYILRMDVYCREHKHCHVTMAIGDISNTDLSSMERTHPLTL